MPYDLNTTCCFTGHRIQKLPWKNNENDKRCKNLKLVLHNEIEKAIFRGYSTFICGMALGFDIICAETVLELKNTYSNIKLIAALPCRNQHRIWNEKDKARYLKILDRADGIRCVYDEYSGAECMLERNEYMVNNSSLMIALFNGLGGGTKFTIDYARKSGLEIIILKA